MPLRGAEAGKSDPGLADAQANKKSGVWPASRHCCSQSSGGFGLVSSGWGRRRPCFLQRAPQPPCAEQLHCYLPQLSSWALLLYMAALIFFSLPVTGQTPFPV